MTTPYRLLATLLTVLALGACASAPPRAATVKPAAAQSVYVTGSRLATPVDPRTGAPETATPIQSVSLNDVKSTGQDNPGQALRMLLPIVH
ncbi:MAG TPA: hypothetical protein VGF89_12680 [Steroidobacteraceae bacterium]|jgi:hypothetical protein